MARERNGEKPKVRLLYFKPELNWPRVSGHDVHCYYMMDALSKLGHEVSFVAETETKPEAIAGLALASCWSLDHQAKQDVPPPRMTRLQSRFASYWGIEHSRIHALGVLARTWEADAVVVDGLNVLPYLAGVESALRVWFAADEWVWHHLSQTRLLDWRSWGNLQPGLIKGVYEWAYASLLDRVWVVSEGDRRAMRWVTGLSAIDLLPNGVDSDHYRPFDVPQEEHSCVFWGRLDFGPNIQALQWFCGKVWPLLRKEIPDARLTIYGFKPTGPVQQLATAEGISLVPDLPDIREHVCKHQVALMPFVSGGGVKSKILEAFSMSLAVIGTPRSSNGLFGGESLPLIQATRPADWVRQIRALWDDSARRKSLGETARQWVLAHHTWEAAARIALAGLTQAMASKPRR